MYSKLDTCLDNCHDPNLIKIRSLLRSKNLTVTVQRLSDFQSVTRSDFNEIGNDPVIDVYENYVKYSMPMISMRLRLM